MDSYNKGVEMNNDGDGDLTTKGIKIGVKLLIELVKDPKGTLLRLYILLSGVLASIFYGFLEMIDYGFSLDVIKYCATFFVSLYFFRKAKHIKTGYLILLIQFIVSAFLINMLFRLFI